MKNLYTLVNKNLGSNVHACMVNVYNLAAWNPDLPDVSDVILAEKYLGVLPSPDPLYTSWITWPLTDQKWKYTPQMYVTGDKRYIYTVSGGLAALSLDSALPALPPEATAYLETIYPGLGNPTPCPIIPVVALVIEDISRMEIIHSTLDGNDYLFALDFWDLTGANRLHVFNLSGVTPGIPILNATRLITGGALGKVQCTDFRIVDHINGNTYALFASHVSALNPNKKGLLIYQFGTPGDFSSTLTQIGEFSSTTGFPIFDDIECIEYDSTNNRIFCMRQAETTGGTQTAIMQVDFSIPAVPVYLPGGNYSVFEPPFYVYSLNPLASRMIGGKLYVNEGGIGKFGGLSVFNAPAGLPMSIFSRFPDVHDVFRPGDPWHRLENREAESIAHDPSYADIRAIAARKGLFSLLKEHSADQLGVYDRYTSLHDQIDPPALGGGDTTDWELCRSLFFYGEGSIIDLDAPEIIEDVPLSGAVIPITQRTISFSILDLPNPGYSGVDLSSTTILLDGVLIFSGSNPLPWVASEFPAAKNSYSVVTRGYEFNLEKDTDWGYGEAHTITINTADTSPAANTATDTITFTTESEPEDPTDPGDYRGGTRDIKNLVVYNPNEEALPDASRQPWVKDGTGTGSLADDSSYLRILDDSPATHIRYIQKLKDKILPKSDFEFSVDMMIIAYTSFSPGSIVFGLADGGRFIHVHLGNHIDLCTVAGVASYVSNERVPVAQRFNLRVYKRGELEVLIYVNDDLVKTYPWHYLPVNWYGDKYFFFGSPFNAKTSEFRIYHLSYAINYRLPTNTDVSTHDSRLKRWITKNNLRTDILRSFSFLDRNARQDIINLENLKESDKATINDLWVTGDILPEDEDYPWSPTSDSSVPGAGLAITNRFSSVEIAATATGKKMVYEYQLAKMDQFHDVDLDFELEIKAEYTKNAAGYLAIHVRIFDGTRYVILGFKEHPTTGVKTAGLINTGIFIGETITIDFTQKIRYRIMKSHDGYVWCSANGIIFDRVAYTDLPTGYSEGGGGGAPPPTPGYGYQYEYEYDPDYGYQYDYEYGPDPGGGAPPPSPAETTPYIQFGHYTSTLLSTTRWKLFHAVVSMCGRVDGSTFIASDPKMGIMQEIFDTNLRPSKMESNTELRWFMEHRIGIQRMRGTEKGILFEIRLITQGITRILHESMPIAWYLETNDFLEWFGLDSGGYYYFNIVETQFDNPHYRPPERIAEWIRRNIFPASTRANTWGLFQFYTVQSVDTTNPLYDEIEIQETNNFIAAEDTITIRKADNSSSEDTTVMELNGTDRIRVEKVAGTYVLNDIIRKFYAGYYKHNISMG